MTKKRVGCLYRVSTLKQVEENDIPMQRRSCNGFIKEKDDWVLEKEYLERGISGYKLKEADRDVLQDVKKDVLNKKIDILLVFMFDRIGRREDETPFVVEWLIEHGVEVWSVKEGQRKIENRADKLINYLTYWQAGGESEKTAIRVRESQVQMAEQGILTYGGKRNAPYGYEFVKSGTYTKKGVERQKLIIKDDEAKIISRIYDMYVTKGYGIDKIAKKLNNEEIKPRRGENWSKSTISAILRNPIYMGYPGYNKRTSKNFEDWILPKEKREDLVIVSVKIWYKAKKIRESRSNKNFKNNPEANDSIPKQTKSKLLFIGMVKCGECNYAFMTSESKKKKKNGEVVTYMYYRCSSSSFTNKCNLNHKSIAKEKFEEPILKTIYDFLDSIEQINLTDKIKKNLEKKEIDEYKDFNICNKKIEELEKNLEILKNEVIKSITGNSEFSPELLNELIETKKEEKKELILQRNEIEKVIAQKKLEDKDLKKFKDMIPVWKEEFENANIEMKKMLLSEIIKSIRVFNDRIEIDLRLELNKYIKEYISSEQDKNISQKNYKIIEDTVLISKE